MNGDYLSPKGHEFLKRLIITIGLIGSLLALAALPAGCTPPRAHGHQPYVMFNGPLHGYPVYTRQAPRVIIIRPVFSAPRSFGRR